MSGMLLRRCADAREASISLVLQRLRPLKSVGSVQSVFRFERSLSLKQPDRQYGSYIVRMSTSKSSRRIRTSEGRGWRTDIPIVPAISLAMRTPSSGLSTRNGRRFFSKSEDIWQYLDKICKVFSLRRYMTFNASVVECRWKPQQGKWSVKYEQIINGQTLAFEETCDILLHLTGVLNKPAWPSVDGLDVFKGKVCENRAGANHLK